MTTTAINELMFVDDEFDLDFVQEEMIREGTIPCGWVPPELRTDKQTAACKRYEKSLDEFQITGHFSGNLQKALLFQARQKLSKKKQPLYIWQSSGSCVGAGGGNACLTLMDVEILLGGENEIRKPIWWLYAYGEGREKAGFRKKGSGSFGHAQAWAMTTKGNLPAEAVDIEMKIYKGWYKHAKSLELEWSDGSYSKFDPQARQHLIKTAARIRSAESAAEALQNGYPLTYAGRFGTKGTRVKGGDKYPVRIANWDGSWAHQQSVDGWWDHPVLGEIFHIMNQWGPRHGKPVDGSPYGGYWVTKKTFERMCRTGEVFAFSAFAGFPGRDDDIKKALRRFYITK